jgi:GntR family transcriptional regulator, transcriptional repressor for pyruvate dehydrogenase complex
MTATRTPGRSRRAPPQGTTIRTLGRAPNLPSQLARMISDEILGGRFKAGERLPTERELAETFGVSRNVVREAIARLTFEGTVEPRQGSGVFVLGTNPIAALRLDPEMLRDRSLFANLFELRSILEGEAASLAAARRGRKHLAAIKAAIFINFISEHVRASIAEANERVDLPSRERINKEEHAAIYEAIAAKDIDGARESMRRHIGKAMERLGLVKS